MDNPILNGLEPNGKVNINSGTAPQITNPILSSLQPNIVSNVPVTPAAAPVQAQKTSIFDTVKNFGSAILKSAESIPSYLLKSVTNPLQTGEGIVNTAVLKPLGFIEGITNSVLSLENKGLNKLGVKTQAPVNVFSGAANAISKIPRTPSQQKAFDTGNFFGWFAPYGKVAGATKLGLSALDLAPKFAKFIPAVADAVGFLGTGQILHTKQEGSRVKQLVNDSIALSLFVGGGFLLRKAGIGIAKKLHDILPAETKKAVSDIMKPISDTVRSGKKVPVGTLDTAVTKANNIIKTDTGFTPKELLQKHIDAQPVQNNEILNSIKDNTSVLPPQKIDTKQVQLKDNTIPKLSPVVKDIQKAKASGKSFNDFANTQPIIYHGTQENFSKFNTKISEGGATWFSSSKEDILSGNSGAVQTNGKKLNIKERFIKPDIKLATPELADKFVSDQLIADGFRGVRYPSPEYGKFEWTKLWFPNEDTFTKSKLKELWDKTNIKAPEIKLPEIPTPTKPILGVAFPGADYITTFVQKDVIPAGVSIKDGIKGIYKASKSLFDISPTEEKASAIVGATQMKAEQFKSAAWSVANTRRDWWKKIQENVHINFMDNIETGKTSAKDFSSNLFSGTSKEMANTYSDLANEYRSRLDKTFAFEADAGMKTKYIKDYFPHMWEDVAKAKEVFQRYANSMSKGAFTKLRTVDLIKLGRENGLKLKTTNPEEITIMREIDGQRISTQIEMFDQLKTEGLALPVNTPNTEAFSSVDTPKGERLAVVPEAAKILNNAFFSDNLWSKKGFFGSLFRSIMGIKGTFVPIKLALSLFHLIHITFIGSSSERSIVYKAIIDGSMNGKQAIKELAKSTSFLSQVEAMKKYGVGESKIKGLWQADIARWWDTPMDKLSPYKRQIVQYIIDGGGTPKMSEEFLVRSRDSFKQAVRDENYIGATIRGLPKIIEGYQKPVFETYIPALKISSYLKGVESLMKLNPELATNTVERQIAFRKLWKSIDNRFGQMNYKTLFWKPVIKQSAQASFLSLGWNLGFVREFGGGALDLGRLLYKLPLGKATRNDVTQKMLFSLDYTFQSALVGGLMTYAMTGKMPTTMQDLFFPNTGFANPDGSQARLNTSFYTREYFSLLNHWRKQGAIGGSFGLLENKLSPVFSTLAQIYENKDYYGYQIRDTNAPAMTQAAQFTKYMVEDALAPISISGAARAKPVTGTEGVVASYLGFNPAPKYISETPLESKIYSILDRRTGGVKPLAQKERTLAKSKIRNLYLTGKVKQANTALTKAVKDGYIAPRGRSAFIRNLDIPTDVRAFGALSQFPTDQEYLLSTMNEKQLQRYVGHASKKVKHILSTLSPTAKKFVQDLKLHKVKLLKFKKGKAI